VLKIIFEAIDNINEELRLEGERAIVKAPATVLFGSNSKLDSLGLINLIVAIEEKIEEEYDVNITLADEKAMSQMDSPFKTVESLVNYICSILEEVN